MAIRTYLTTHQISPMMSMPFCLISLLLTGCLQQQVRPSISIEEIHEALSSTKTPILNEIQQVQQQQVQQQQQLEQVSSELAELKQNIKSYGNQAPTTQAQPVLVSKTQCKVPEDRMLDGRLILGRVEWVLLSEINDLFKARIDTGATTSSISADRITLFERDGKKWVKFFLTHDGTDDVPIESKLIRYAKVRQASADEPDKRPVVRLNIRIGQTTEAAEFTLTDRSTMTYPVLLGREFLKDVALVNVAKKFLHGKPKLLAPNKPAPAIKPVSLKKKSSDEKPAANPQTENEPASTQPEIQSKEGS
jgi:hypothetical protein